MKRKVLLGVVLAVLFIGCDLGTGGSDSFSLGDLKAKSTDIKSLYVSNIPKQQNSRVAATTGSVISTLSYINESGQNSPFYFTSPSGKNIVLNVQGMDQIDDKRITVSFDSYYEIFIGDNTYTIGATIPTDNMTALIDLANNKVYEFTKWDIEIIQHDTIYATGRDYTLYEINLNNITVASPLNNREYYEISRVVPKILFDNKLISGNNASSHYVIDVNNAFPIKNIQHAYITADMCSFIPANQPYKADFYSTVNGLVLQDLNDNPWFFITGGKMPSLNNYSNLSQSEKYFLGKISIDDEGQVILSDYYEETFSFRPTYERTAIIFYMNSANNGTTGSIDYDILYTSRCFNATSFVMIFDNGIVRLGKTDAGIQVESFEVQIQAPNIGGQNSFIKDNYLYYLDGTAIKRLHLSSGSSPETIYANTRILTSGSTVQYLIGTGDSLIFYQFAEDNMTVNTYLLSMNEPELQPKLLSSISADIRNIVELDF
jgi:hypothetical protein